MSHSAELVEIFSSLQGEGPYVGTPTTFVRFERCTMRCRFCDTPEGLCHHEVCRIESPPCSGEFREIPNPVTAAKLCKELIHFTDEMLSITGGEPLEQTEFLAEWLPTQTPLRKILLETNGINHVGLLAVLPHIHTISMDIKLPSSTGRRPRWREHTEFLRSALAVGKEIYIKMVVTSKTTDRDIELAIGVVSGVNRHIPIILQPASPTLAFHDTIPPERTQSILRFCHAYLPNVSITPQMHKEWGIR